MKKNSTLLEKALLAKRGRNRPIINDELIELAIAWAKSEITMQQAHIALGLPVSGAGAYSKLAIALRQAVTEGKLKVA